MGLNWVFQFEAFKVSSVAIGTVSYNTMPIFLLIISFFVFKEKIQFFNIICIIISTFGIFLVSNVLNNGLKSNEVLGCFYGILGAIFYALIVVFNRKLKHIQMYDKIIFQFGFSTLIMFIYIYFIQHGSIFFVNNLDYNKFVIGLICVILLGVFHTGFCYLHYFNAVSNLNAQVVAILTYIDPVVSLLLSYFILKEKTTNLQLLGAALIMISTLTNEIVKNKKAKLNNIK